MPDFIQVNRRKRTFWKRAALIPRNLDRIPPTVRRNIEMRDELDRRHFRIEGVALAFGGCGKAGFNRVPREVHRMAAHVANLASAPVPVHVPMEAAALEILRVVRMKWRGTEP